MASFTGLALTKTQYNGLKVMLPGNSPGVLVFQFLVTSSVYNLRAYIMKNGHVSINSTNPNSFQKTLSAVIPPPPFTSMPKSVSTTPPPTTNIIVGDLQIDTVTIEQLKRDSNPSSPETYDYFHFTPSFEPSSQHVFYILQVVPSTNVGLAVITKSVNPSPPATAK